MIVQHGNQQYVYKTVREGEKTRKIYIGRISSPQAQEFLQTAAQKEVEQETRKRITSQREKMTEQVENASDMTSLIVRLGLILHGHYVRRSEIRKIRRAS